MPWTFTNRPSARHAANGFVHNEALAYELTARFYAARGFEEFAHVYLRNARDGYLRWGADGKVRQLEQLHPHLRDAAIPASATTTIGAPVEQLDVGTVVKALRRLCRGEIVLGELIKTLLRIAGRACRRRERGLIILFQGDEPRDRGGKRRPAAASLRLRFATRPRRRPSFPKPCSTP